MKDVSILVGKHDAEREKRFVGAAVGEWKGFSNDKRWWMSATIYQTQKSNWAVHLVTVAHATLLTDKKTWKESGDYLIDSHQADLFIGSRLQDFDKKLPEELCATLAHLMEKNEKPVEYLDI